MRDVRTDAGRANERCRLTIPPWLTSRPAHPCPAMHAPSCCGAVSTFLEQRCQCDPTLLSVLPAGQVRHRHSMAQAPVLGSAAVDPVHLCCMQSSTQVRWHVPAPASTPSPAPLALPAGDPPGPKRHPAGDGHRLQGPAPRQQHLLTHMGRFLPAGKAAGRDSDSKLAATLDGIATATVPMYV